ncbi:D-Ala-D-Ala carboxypeptidase family metallohydrolase [Aestuariivirga sp. YIM B02566]|uniref:DUF882 domain-containing protein n=1 Tax=Taklimakanibacter albus TaxID=2800327 RepID=A0ACC5RG46_9HYPH|nr:D-Ala-D-Ala carboxypeptidase family metallohydrolase [Aestuariivirga sp. YIM B02566]MBK1871575.1 DUF882 domain-containing protein [Aestuariivirga sp. YIM B02566]
MARIPSPTIQLNERIQPQATPTDSYVRVAEPPKSSLWGLAEGLEKFDTGLQSFLAEKRQKQAEADAIKGETAFYQNNSKGYAEGVRDGSIPASASPIFIKNYKKAQGNSMGRRLAGDMAIAYELWDGKDSTDPAAFDSWFSNYVSTNLKETDEEVLAGILPQLRVSAENLHNANLKGIADKTYSDGVKAHVASATVRLDELNTLGVETKEGVSYDQIWEDITKQRQDAIASGVRSDDFDKELVAMIASKAIEHQDPAIMQLLDRALPGKKYAIKDDPQFRSVRQQTEEQLMALAVKQQSEEYTRQERADAKRKKELQGAAIEQLFKDPDAQIPEEVLKEGSKLDGNFRIDILNARKAINESGGMEDPRAVAEVYRKIAEGGGTKVVMDAMNNGVLTGSFKEAWNFAKAVEDSTGRGGGILKDGNTQRIRDAIYKRTAVDTGLNMLDPSGWSDDGLAAVVDFERGLIQWDQAHPDASALERSEAINKIGKQILDNINADPEVRGYSSPTGPTDQNPFGKKPEEAPVEEQPAKPQGEQKQGAVEQSAPEERIEGTAFGNLLDQITQKYDLPEGFLSILHQIEAGGRLDPPDSVAGAGGPFQIMPDTAKEFGVADTSNFEQSADGAGKIAQSHGKQLRNIIGRDYTEEELYMAYQQGAGGAGALLNNPDSNAVDVLTKVYKGNKKKGRSAVIDNGGRANMTAKEFTDAWTRKWRAEKEGMGISPPDINTLTPGTRSLLENLAKQRGLDPKDIIKEAWKNLKEADAGAFVSRNVNSDGPPELDPVTQGKRKPLSIVDYANRGASPEELARTDPKVKRIWENAVAATGYNLRINSAARDPVSNRKRGGAQSSQHLKGKALDIDVKDLPKADRIRLIRMFSRMGAKGIGIYKNSIHIDVRGKKASWGQDYHLGSVPEWAKAAINEHLGSP